MRARANRRRAGRQRAQGARAGARNTYRCAAPTGVGIPSLQPSGLNRPERRWSRARAAAS
eukprot:9848028-Alexandrium_andersonii.AAC.1